MSYHIILHFRLICKRSLNFSLECEDEIRYHDIEIVNNENIES